jgi:hypothetical protein
MKRYHTLTFPLSTIAIFAISLLNFPSLGAQPRRLSLSSLEESLHNGKVIKSSSEMYFDLTAGRIITMATTPEEFIYMSDIEGNADIYYPSRNSRVTNKNLVFSTRNNNLWFFLNGQGYDLGLQGMGFRVEGIRNEDSYTITTWQAPLRYLKEVDKIDLVHENHLPVYLEYRNTKGAVTLKVYYEGFVRTGESMVPSRVTEIIFVSPKDSTIRRSTYTNLKWGTQADTKGFDYTIPADAKKLK